MPDAPRDDTADAFRRVLNKHGYGFQYRALQACNNIQHHGNGYWSMLAGEVPVRHNDKDLHIDGILEFHSHWSEGPQRYVVVECKRANPSLSRWCFAGASKPFTLGVDIYNCASGNIAGPTKCKAHTMAPSAPVAHVGMELRTHKPGESDSGKQFDEALTQVLRGTAAFVETMKQWTRRPRVVVIPMIITTADLSFTETTLGSADLSTGDLPGFTAIERRWLWHETNVSRSLSPIVDRERDTTHVSNPIESALQHESRRPVAIVNFAGIPEALAALADADFGEMR